MIAIAEYSEVEMICIQCRCTYLVRVKTEEYFKWQSGILIQFAMPNLSLDDRELLISHICGPCFDKLFK